MDAAALRSRFPVTGRVAYLNAGTCGPVPADALEAATAELRRETESGRAGMPHFERRGELAERLRAAYAARLGCAPQDVALTASTTDGIATALAGLELEPGDEVLTADSEHPGVLGPLSAVRDLRGATVRTAPLAELPAAAGPRTRAVVCSHVNWLTGEVAPMSDLAQLEAPVILDGAQGIGAVAMDVEALGCEVYAGSGQKWLCGPEGLGMLYVAPDFQEHLAPTRRGYTAQGDASLGLDAGPAPGALRYEPPANHGATLLAYALASHDVLDAAGWDEVHARARDLAADLAAGLTQRGLDVADRGPTTLVAWHDPEMEATARRLAERGVAVRHLPGRDLVRASVGAWNDESDLERLLDAL
ncbi:MAG: L-cysteine/cystine lyase [Solirubrobacteraceae bacterium]|jgi:L-cysteine/cystine lyase|nr:L-cysteine/cystine lyase [Solirubrobacteraceae bacterium]